MQKSLAVIFSQPKGSKHLYETLCSNKHTPNCCQKWESKLGVSIHWRKVFIKVSKIKEVKLRWLQIRLINRILATNVILKAMRISANDACAFCADEKESIEHLFTRCAVVNKFWNDLVTLTECKCEHIGKLKLTNKLILFGFDEGCVLDGGLENILMEAKSYIYRCRYDNSIPTIQAFLCHLKRKYRVLRHAAEIEMNLAGFNETWMNYKSLVDHTF